MKKSFLLVAIILVSFNFLYSTVRAQQDTLNTLWQQRSQQLQQLWQQRIQLLEQGWQIRSEMIERNWNEQRKLILSQWRAERKQMGLLHDVDFGEDENSNLFRTELDFEKSHLQVTGIAYGKTAEDARKSAVSLAKEKLHQRNFDLPVDNENRLRDVLKDPSLKITKQDVEQVIKTTSYPTQKEISSLNDGGFQAKVVAEQPLHGKNSISEIMTEIAGKLVRNKSIPKLLSSDIATSILEKVKQLAAGQSYTGLIIDATGTGIKPCMAPTVITEAGKEVYGALVVEKKYALDHGMAVWAKSMEKAKKESRIGNNPLVVKAIGKVGNFMLVVDLESAAKILLAGEKSDFLKKCKVVIILS